MVRDNMNAYSDIELCREWETERVKHPFYAEKMSKDSIFKCWESVSEKYSAERYSIIREEIIADLSKRGILDPNYTMIDIGSGPGTFAIPMSRHVREIICLDSSQGMIRRLESECSAANVNNIKTVLEDWECYKTGGRFDLAFTSLCPPMNTPESIMKMEACAKEHCIYVSSMNDNSEMISRIWKAVGKNYSYAGYNTKYPYDFLKIMGRSPKLRELSQDQAVDIPLDEAVENEVKRLLPFVETTEGVRKTVAEVMADYADGPQFRIKSKMKVGLLTWEPG
jgi:Methylase involved in ubiquinone/menaquinone biosynthesis